MLFITMFAASKKEKMESKELKYISRVKANRIKDLIKSLSKDYVKLIYEIEPEICSFGVFTDSDISSFSFAYNTKEEAQQTGESIKSTFPADDNKWWIPDWQVKVDEESFRYDAREIELFKILEDLINLTASDDDYCENDDFSNYKSDVFELICQSLKEIKDENTFSNVSEDFYLLVQEQDNGIYGSRKKSLAKILTQKQLDEYSRYDRDNW